MELKLYFWEKRYGSVADGMFFALAYDADHARNLILARAQPAYRDQVAELIKGPPTNYHNGPYGNFVMPQS